MNDKNIGLETFVDHHRADFDVFEPRADLWDAIAQDLDLTETLAEAEAAPLRVLPLFAEAPLRPVAAPDTAAVRSARPYGVAAAVATLLLLGTWFWQHRTEATIWTRTGRPALAQLPADYYAGSELPATTAAAGPEQRLASAVQRMESYYATQLTEREQELRRADSETAVAPQADWQQELAALDSTYQQLKTELYRNPEPDVVLEAMNRNMQIRLDLLAQQLRTRERIRDYHSQPYMVADSRRIP
ncbi:hypothetical protein KLP40_02090 [Hymenobacter sp. NST-14]|uniref:hypothetical protein n=1 Tax=Hymenobacter piscis TaxID=2839984 RepID=UPI001C02B0DC|nr:hypothetical protein [Hymenobacter piscis]MBT9391941.1 hypothetical protein [Hymenobacter piscis]